MNPLGVVYQATSYLAPYATVVQLTLSTGLLAFDTAPDYETKTSLLQPHVAASDGTNSATQDIAAVNVTNLNDNSPSFTSSAGRLVPQRTRLRLAQFRQRMRMVIRLVTHYRVPMLLQ